MHFSKRHRRILYDRKTKSDIQEHHEIIRVRHLTATPTTVNREEQSGSKMGKTEPRRAKQIREMTLLQIKRQQLTERPTLPTNTRRISRTMMDIPELRMSDSIENL